jgi:hypothetical protein
MATTVPIRAPVIVQTIVIINSKGTSVTTGFGARRLSVKV